MSPPGYFHYNAKGVGVGEMPPKMVRRVCECCEQHEVHINPRAFEISLLCVLISREGNLHAEQAPGKMSVAVNILLTNLLIFGQCVLPKAHCARLKG